MISNRVTPQEVCDLLNDAVKLDPRAMNELYNFRVEVNYPLANHETIQVRKETTGEHTLSFLGLLNGMFGVNDNNYGAIAVVVEDNNPEKILRFEVLPN